MNIWTGFVGLLENILLTFQAWTGNSGVAIILFTIVARAVILPLTLQSLRSSRGMQAIQPQMKELQRKHGKDQQRLNEEMIKLYRENKINPAGGCLPLFLQLPIFFAVYQAVINLAQIPPSEAAAQSMVNALGSAGLETAAMNASLLDHRLSTSFLWLRDLGIPDPLYILPVLSVLFQLIVQLMSTPRIQDPQQKAMMNSMLIMPIVFGYIGFTFPSGAVLYWVAGSILSMIQTFAISGWGSLANYLKFLPTNAGLFPPPTVILPTDDKAPNAPTGKAVETLAGDAGPRRSFWDVLAPLTEQAVPAASAAAEIPRSDPATEAALAETRKSIRQQPNPRRRNKARR
ncbi:MAG: membrane protein insertase YidC [Roseiflexaceae bacterium]|nr:membrane protein insertase YidC [Roseiflexaceae bacterium]